MAGTKARIYDTRKTTPGWRRLEKYAVRCGGGWNHRGSLFEAVLIKDNHLALGSRQTGPFAGRGRRRAREFVRQHAAEAPTCSIEVEVDTLDQLEVVLAGRPDIVLLDNMTAAELREAVARRDAVDPAIELEASGGVNLATVRGDRRDGRRPDQRRRIDALGRRAGLRPRLGVSRRATINGWHVPELANGVASGKTCPSLRLRDVPPVRD